MQLSEIQNRFRDLMLDHPDALNAPDADFAAIFANDDIPLPERLKVYRNNIVGSLTDVMKATFPVILKLVGEAFFEKMARSFILGNPPRSGCLNFYGAGFDDFVAGFSPAKTLPYLADVAKFEIALNDAYYARDEKPLAPEDLAAVAAEDLGSLPLKLCDCIKLINSSYPLMKIRDFCRLEDTEGKTLNLDQGGGYFMITRTDFESRAVLLSQDEYRMLDNLRTGQPLGAAIEDTLEAHPDFDFNAFLQRHLALETFLALNANTA